MSLDKETRLHRLYEALKDLTDGQIGWVETVAE
jgi:hypothetical protein